MSHKGTAAACLLALFALAGCKDKEAMGVMDKVAPVLEAAQNDLSHLPALLPAQPSPLSCSARLDQKVGFLDEREIHRVLDEVKIDNTDRERDWTLTFNPASRFSRIPSRKELAKLRDDPTYPEAHDLLTAYETLGKERYAVVYRTQDSDPGKVQDDKIVSPAHWKGWVFLVDVRAGKLLADAPIDARSDDHAEYVSLHGHKVKTMAEVFSIAPSVEKALDSCGIKLSF